MSKTNKAGNDNPYGRPMSHLDSATLAEYRDDKLSAETKSQVQDHVSECTSCRTDFLEMCRGLS
jgi:hypothetical protein